MGALPSNISDKLVHHSDRGGQYCSLAVHRDFERTQYSSGRELQMALLTITVSPRRWSRILKQGMVKQYGLRRYRPGENASRESYQGIYNTRRPHMAIGLEVPDQAHRDKKSYSPGSCIDAKFSWHPGNSRMPGKNKNNYRNYIFLK